MYVFCVVGRSTINISLQELAFCIVTTEARQLSLLREMQKVIYLSLLCSSQSNKTLLVCYLLHSLLFRLHIEMLLVCCLRISFTCGRERQKRKRDQKLTKTNERTCDRARDGERWGEIYGAKRSRKTKIGHKERKRQRDNGFSR